MHITKRIIPILLVGGAALAAVFIIGSAALGTGDKKPEAVGRVAPRTSGAPPPQRESIATLPPPRVEAASNLARVGSGPPAAPATVNITELLAERIAERMITEKADNASLLQRDELLRKLPPESVLRDAFEGGMIPRGEDLFQGTVDLRRLRTTDASDPEAIRAYLAGFAEIAKKNTAFSLDPARLSLDAFPELIAAHTAIIADLYTLVIPKLFRDWHTRYLKLMDTQRKLFDTLSMSSADPLKSLVALQMLPAMESELRLLEVEFQSLVKKSNVAG